MTSANIKYVLMGNVSNEKIMAEHIVIKNNQVQSEAKQIFEKISKSGEKKVEERNKIEGTNGNYFFTITAPNIFYLVHSEHSYPERHVFAFVDQLNKDNIPLLINEKGELNSAGKQSLKNVVEKYQDINNLSNISRLESDVRDIKLEMNQNIKNMVSNVDDTKNLEGKAGKIKDNAELFKKDAKKLERMTWCQNCKWTIIILIIIIAIILAIVLPLTLKK
jgi:hypothetical protein